MDKQYLELIKAGLIASVVAFGIFLAILQFTSRIYGISLVLFMFPGAAITSAAYKKTALHKQFAKVWGLSILFAIATIAASFGAANLIWRIEITDPFMVVLSVLLAIVCPFILKKLKYE